MAVSLRLNFIDSIFLLICQQLLEFAVWRHVLRRSFLHRELVRRVACWRAHVNHATIHVELVDVWQCSLFLFVAALDLARRAELERRVRVDPQWSDWVDIHELVFLCAAVRTENLELFVVLGFLSQVADAEPTDVVLAAARNKDGVEVAETDGAIVLENLPFFFVIGRIIIPAEDLFLADVCLDSHLVPLPNVC